MGADSSAAQTSAAVPQSPTAAVMVSWAVLVLAPLWILGLLQVCRAEELPRAVLLSWVRERLLEGLGLLEPPAAVKQRPIPGARLRRAGAPRTGGTLRVAPDQDGSEMILFPTPADSSCSSAAADTTMSLRFRPSIGPRDAAVVSARLWFFAGANASSSLFIVTAAQQRLLAARAPPTCCSPDGWSTFDLDDGVLGALAEGPFLLQIQSQAQRAPGGPDHTPFLHLHVRPRAPVRSPREAPVPIPWSPSALRLLQRPSDQGPRPEACRRQQVEISFQELGWDSWVVHPRALSFSYCHGNCSTAMLGMAQCCAPDPGTMRSLRVTTTSDGGYSFRQETLPNIMAEDCTCF